MRDSSRPNRPATPRAPRSANDARRARRQAAEIDGRPAFFSPFAPTFKTETRYIPFEEASTTRVRTYEEKYSVLLFKTRTVEIDYGLPTATIARLKTLVEDFATAIQVAIDEANAQARDEDALLNDVAAKVLAEFERQWKPENNVASTDVNASGAAQQNG